MTTTPVGPVGPLDSSLCTPSESDSVDSSSTTYQLGLPPEDVRLLELQAWVSRMSEQPLCKPAVRVFKRSKRSKRSKRASRSPLPVYAKKTGHHPFRSRSPIPEPPKLSRPTVAAAVPSTELPADPVRDALLRIYPDLLTLSERARFIGADYGLFDALKLALRLADIAIQARLP